MTRERRSRLVDFLETLWPGYEVTDSMRVLFDRSVAGFDEVIVTEALESLRWSSKNVLPNPEDVNKSCRNAAARSRRVAAERSTSSSSSCTETSTFQQYLSSISAESRFADPMAHVIANARERRVQALAEKSKEKESNDAEMLKLTAKIEAKRAERRISSA